MTIDSIKENLRRDYEYLNSQNEINSFIIGLADYVNYIETIPEFKSIIDGWLEKKSKIYENIVSLENKAVRELKNTKIILERLINSKKGVKEEITKTGGVFNDGLTRLNQYLNHDPNFGAAGIPSEVINGYLEEIARDLTEKGHIELLNKFTIAERGNGRKWEFSKSLKQRWQLSKEFKLQRQMEVWGNWDDIALAPTIVPFLGGFDNKELLEISDLDPDLWGTYYGFISLIHKKKDIENLIERMKICATRVYKQLLKELPERLNSNGEDRQVTKDKNINKIKSITIIKPNDPEEEKYKFVINDCYSRAKAVSRGSWKALIKVIEGEMDGKNEVQYNKSIADYFNYNHKCSIYKNGGYNLTTILQETPLGKFKTDNDVRTEIISELTYKKRLKKESKT